MSILLLVVILIVIANAFDKCPLWPAVLILALAGLYGSGFKL